MMRELKFRAWVGERMIGPFTLGDIANNFDCGYSCGTDLPNSKPVHSDDEGWDNLVFMQFTGLLDREGKEIWEGDLVTYAHSNDFYSIPQPLEKHGPEEVKYQPGLAFEPLPHEEYCGGPDGSVQYHDFKVVGNIYENPELLADSHKPSVQ